MNFSEEIAQYLNCTRTDFDNVFEHVRQNQNDTGTHSFKFLALSIPVGENSKAFTVALCAAENDGWFDALIRRLKQFDYIEFPTYSKPVTELQKMLNPNDGFQDPMLLNTALSRHISQICLLEIDNSQSLGSGFLVGPNAIITSWHVIHSLLDQKSGKPKPGSGKQIKVRFDHVTNARKQEVIHVYKDEWLLHQSPCHTSELSQNNGVTTSNFSNDSLVDSLDFAIIALASCPGHERGFVDLGRAKVPAADSAGYVLQHPEAFEQRIAQGDFEGFRPGTDEQRLLYSINTLKGSSGGMIVDSEHNFIGLHQGAVPEPINGLTMNTGILGRAIHDNVGAIRLPHASTVLQFRRYDGSGPIIGREKCQKWIHECLEGKLRLMHVYAKRGNKGASFSYKIMRACLPEAKNKITIVSAGMLALDAEETAAYLLQQMGIHHTHLPDPKQAETTQTARIKSRLLPVFRDRVNAASKDKLHWLVIDNIDSEPLPDSGVRRFLEALYTDIENFPNLRIVLIGLRTIPPGETNTIMVQEEIIQDPDQDEIGRYIRMRYTEKQIDFDYQGGEIERLATLVERSGTSDIKLLDPYVRNKVDPMIDTSVQES